MSIEEYSQELGHDERTDYRIAQDADGTHLHGYYSPGRPDGLAIIGAIAEWCVNRAALVLPTVPIEDAVPYVIAAQAHAARPTPETFAAMLEHGDALGDAERLSADDAWRVDLFNRAAALSYLQADDDLYRVPTAPIDAVKRAQRRTDGTVVGRREASVIGDGVTFVRPDGTVGERYGRMTSAECLERAHLLMVADGGDTPLVGTEACSWEQVVSFKPETFTLDGVTLNGAPLGAFVFAPYGAGASTTGEARKRRTHAARVARYVAPALKFPADAERADVKAALNGSHGQTYANRCEESTVLAWDAEYRIVKRYRTAFDGRYVIGHGAWQGTPRAARKATTVRRAALAAQVPTCTVTDALAHLERAMSDAFTNGAPSTYTVRTDTGVTLKGTHSPAGRSFVMVASWKSDGATVATRKVATRASLAGAMSAARRAVA